MSRVTLTLPITAAAFLAGAARGEVTLSGVDGELERNVLAYSSLANEPCDAERWLVERRFRTLERDARTALEPFGYYHSAIEASLAFDDECWHAVVEIDPGEPVRYRNVSLSIDGEGAQDPVLTRLIEPPPIEAGSVLRHSTFTNLKRGLQIRAADRGYVEAEFSSSLLDIWPDEGVADASLHLDSGPRYRLSEIRVEQSFLEPDLVEGYLSNLTPGNYFDNADLTATYRDLSESGYFNRIEVVPLFEEAGDQQIPVRVALTPGNRLEYTVGVGASTDTGLRFRAGYRNNRLNTRGHRIIADLNLSTVVQGVTGEYRIPLADPRREWFSVTTAFSREETDTFINEQQSVGVRWTRALSATWLRTFSVDFTNESFNVGEEVDTRRSIVPAAVLDHKLADRDIFPTRGRRFAVELRGTDPALGSQNAYVRTSVRARWIRSFGEGNRVLLRANAGSLTTEDFDKLPPTVRFFAGGDESVRGFDYESLGPTDEEGNVIGGRRLLVASVEYERHLKGNFYGALFVDAGNAFDDTFEAEVGTGPGLKWISPLGPIRFYLGVPVTGDDHGVRLHVRLGADL